MNQIKYILLILLCLIFSGEGHANRIWYNDLSLRELIKSSPYILVVEKRDPFITTKTKPIHWNILKYKPYKQKTYHYKINEVLYSQNGESLPSNIDVLPANSQKKLYIYKKYELEGIGKSPIYERYNTSSQFNKENKLIVFLYKPDNNFEFYCEEAYESFSKRSKILKIMKKFNKTPNNILEKEGYIEISGGCEVYQEAKITFKPQSDKIIISLDNKGGYFWKDNNDKMQSFSTTIDQKTAENFFNEFNSIVNNRKETQSASTRNATVKTHLPLKEKTIDLRWNELEEINGKMYEIDPLLDLIDKFIQKNQQ